MRSLDKEEQRSRQKDIEVEEKSKVSLCINFRKGARKQMLTLKNIFFSQKKIRIKKSKQKRKQGLNLTKIKKKGFKPNKN